MVSLGIFPSPAFANSLLSATGDTRASYPKPEGDIALDNYFQGFNYLSQGGIGLTFMLHEIGHALGLKHPIDDGNNGRPTFLSLGIGNLDSQLNTVMSYTDGSGSPLGTNMLGNPSTPMPLDILAIQQIYGANTTYHTGNDFYRFDPSGALWTIWDAGGNDTFDGSGINAPESIDLRPGSLSSSLSNKLAIAYNVTIENATGGNHNDTLIGNDANNILDGGSGDDSLTGGLGNDTYLVDSPYDAAMELSGQGVDTVIATSSFTLPDFVENLTLSGSSSLTATGNALNNIITGNQGADILIGAAGNDTLIATSNANPTIMFGGSGNDAYYVTATGLMPGNALFVGGEPGNYLSYIEPQLVADPAATTSVTIRDLTGNGAADDIQFNYMATSLAHFYSFEINTNHIDQDLVAGTYDNAERAPFASTGHPGLDLSFDGRGTNTVFGSFTINDIAIDYSTGTPVLARLSVDFTFSENANGPRTFGSFHFGEPDMPLSSVFETNGAGTDQVISSVS